MEIKEALEILTCLRFDDDDIGIAIEKAIRALKKREGKKPVNRRCPNCKSDNIEVWQDGGYVTTKFNFCPACGQRIDWSEDDGA